MFSFYKQSTLSKVMSALILSTLVSCGNNASMMTHTDGTSSQESGMNQNSHTLKPAQTKPAWGKEMTDPMAVVIEKLVSFNAPPLVSLPAQEARKQPTPADATMAVMQEHNIPAPMSNVDTTGVKIPVEDGQIHLRIYTPNTGKNDYPIIVYYHGGGWVIADLDTYNASAEGLANQVEAIVVSVAYRQAPEFKFPTAHNDSYAAYEWAVNNASSIKGDPNRVAVVGESAGGNLACAVSLMARENGFQLPVHQVLIYPIAGYDFKTPSYLESDNTKPLNKDLMKWFFEKYLASPSDGEDPLISLVSANLRGLPESTIIAAQYDPLTSEGETLADNLRNAGVKVNYKLYRGTTHEFFGMGAVVPEAKEAQAMAASELKNSFKK